MFGYLFAVGLTLLVPVPKDQSQAEALKALQGEWVVIASEEFGRPGELYTGDIFTFDGENLSHESDPKTLKFKIRIFPKAEPTRIEWKPALPADSAWSHRGIYKIEDDKLIICMVTHFDTKDETDRPREFHTKADREKGAAPGSVLVVLERKKVKAR